MGSQVVQGEVTTEDTANAVPDSCFPEPSVWMGQRSQGTPQVYRHRRRPT